MKRYTMFEEQLDGRRVWRVRDNEECRITMGHYRTEADAQYSIDYAFSDRPDPRDQRIAELEAALAHVVEVLDSPAYRAWMERVAAIDATLLSEAMPRVDMRRLRALQKSTPVN